MVAAIKAKLIEIHAVGRDMKTVMIPAVATMLQNDGKPHTFVLRHIGAAKGHIVLVTPLTAVTFMGRTDPVKQAEKWLVKNWDEIGCGGVVDLAYIHGHKDVHNQSLREKFE